MEKKVYGRTRDKVPWVHRQRNDTLEGEVMTERLVPATCIQLSLFLIDFCTILHLDHCSCHCSSPWTWITTNTVKERSFLLSVEVIMAFMKRPVKATFATSLFTLPHTMILGISCEQPYLPAVFIREFSNWSKTTRSVWSLPEDLCSPDPNTEINMIFQE
jgi:hypothetical protein